MLTDPALLTKTRSHSSLCPRYEKCYLAIIVLSYCS